MPFEDGKSGNPGGRPKRKIFTEALRIVMLQYASEPLAVADKPRRIDMAALKLAEKAEAGDLAAIRDVRDTLDGKPAQAIEHSGMIAATHEELLKQLDSQTDDEPDREEDSPPAA